MTFEIPTIETKRLLLRGHKADDFAAASLMWADPMVVKFIGGQPSTSQQTWARILGYLGHWDLMGFGYWAIELKDSRTFIGELGFADFKREITPSISGIPELGWALIPAAHGKGYAQEALEAVIGWGQKNLKSDEIVSIINTENIKSH